MCVNLYQTGPKSTRTSAPATASPLSTRNVLIDAGAMGLTNNRPYAMNPDPSPHQIDGHKAVCAPPDVKYSREDHDQRQAEGSKRRKLSV